MYNYCKLLKLIKRTAPIHFKIFFLQLIFAIANTNVSAQEQNRIEHGSMVDSRPNEFIRLTTLRIRFSTAPIATNNQLSFAYHIGNTWNPTTALYFPGADVPPLTHEWDVIKEPQYKDAPGQYKIYGADGVLRGGSLCFIHKTSESNELVFKINMYSLVGGNNWIDIPVSDHILEGFHEKFLGQQDPFRRQINPMDQALIQFIDRNGREFEMNNNDSFVGSLDIADIKYFNIVKNEKVLWTANFGAHFGIPLNQFRSHISAGLSVGTAMTTKVFKGYSFTVAGGIMGQDDRAIRLHPDKINFADQRYVGGYRFLLSHNFDFKNGKRFLFGLELQGMTRPTSIREGARGPADVTSIGLNNQYVQDYWTPTNNYNTTAERKGARGLLTGSEYITLNFSYRFGEANDAPILSFYIQEDWKVFMGTRFGVLFLQSDNVQDFGAGLKFAAPLSFFNFKKRKN